MSLSGETKDERGIRTFDVKAVPKRATVVLVLDILAIIRLGEIVALISIAAHDTHITDTSIRGCMQRKDT